MDYQDYIWDLGGTLLDNYETSTAAFVRTLASLGLEASHDGSISSFKSQRTMQCNSLHRE